MKHGHLSQYFSGAAAKRLSAVETDPTRSNQHEFGIIRPMLEFLGTPTGKREYPATIIYFPADGEEPVTEESYLTVYDSRANQPNRSPEYRAYYPAHSEAIRLAREGDLMVIARRQESDELLVVITEQGAAEEQQLSFLFGFDDPGRLFQSLNETDLDTNRGPLDFTAKQILEVVGIVAEEPPLDDGLHLDEMIRLFGSSFPTTREFSEYARSTVRDVNPVEDPDEALIAWVEREEQLFRLFERYLLERQLAEDFTSGSMDVDRFISLSLSIHNRRKSRAGHSLEGHIETILLANGISFTRNGITENRSKPDFIFPSVTAYHSSDFPQDRLAMLAVKSTLKDRWRQILAEADRIPRKHLATLQPGLTDNQLVEMKDARVQLVVARSMHEAYGLSARAQLMTLADLIEEIRQRAN